MPPPQVRVKIRQREQTLAANLDTVIIEPDDRRVLLLWRACVPLPEGPHELRAVAVS